MDQRKKKELERLAYQLRITGLRMVQEAHSGHIGGAFSLSEIMAVLYFDKMNIRPKEPDWEERDRFVLSKGHCAPGLYSTLAQRGYFSPEELKKLRHIGAMLQGHPDMKGTPGVDMSTGSLGQGVSAAAGMALAAKMDGKSYRVYALLGDGELEEGQVWEAAMFAAHHNLDNLCLIVDYNGLQIDGDVGKVAGIAPIDEKFRSFGFEVAEADGHDFQSLEDAFAAAKACEGRPFAIIAKTTKGKGVSFMENQAGWHGKAPNQEQYEQAMAELNAALEKIS